MLSVDIQNNIIALQNIRQEQLGSILNWCNMTDDFKFATGMEGPVGMETLENKFLQTACSEMEFFLGIHSFFENRLVGIITGKIAGSVLWINMMAVGWEFRGKGYGSISVGLLLRHMTTAGNIKDAYLAVADGNAKGRSFWLRNGFCAINRVCGKATINGKKYNVIIMQKRL